jgi:hypothetical protein
MGVLFQINLPGAPPPGGGGGGGAAPPSHAFIRPPYLESLASGLSHSPGMGCKTLHFLSPVHACLPREQAESLTRATQPGLVSPGGSDQVPSGEPLIRVRGKSPLSLRHVVCYSVKQTVACVCK